MTVVKGDTAGRPALGRVRVLSPQGVVRGSGLLVLPGVVPTGVRRAVRLLDGGSRPAGGRS